MVDYDKKVMLNADEVAKMLGIKKTKAYQLIRMWNQELKSQGRLTIRGRVNRKFFEQKLEV